MDKFFASLMILVVSSLMFSFVTMFESNSNASTFKHGINIMLKSNGMQRSPAIGSNKEVK